jgi:hypothetical protein
VPLKSTIFLDITPCIPEEYIWCHLQGRRISLLNSVFSRAVFSACRLFRARFLLGLLSDPENGDVIFLRNNDLLSPDVISWKTELFNFEAVQII